MKRLKTLMFSFLVGLISPLAVNNVYAGVLVSDEFSGYQREATIENASAVHTVNVAWYDMNTPTEGTYSDHVIVNIKNENRDIIATKDFGYYTAHTTTFGYVDPYGNYHEAERWANSGNADIKIPSDKPHNTLYIDISQSQFHYGIFKNAAENYFKYTAYKSENPVFSGNLTPVKFRINIILFNTISCVFIRFDC